MLDKFFRDTHTWRYGAYARVLFGIGAQVCNRLWDVGEEDASRARRRGCVARQTASRAELQHELALGVGAQAKKQRGSN